LPSIDNADLSGILCTGYINRTLPAAVPTVSGELALRVMDTLPPLPLAALEALNVSGLLPLTSGRMLAALIEIEPPFPEESRPALTVSEGNESVPLVA